MDMKARHWHPTGMDPMENLFLPAMALAMLVLAVVAVVQLEPVRELASRAPANAELACAAPASSSSASKANAS
jgi:hypothetical protein